jgi:hypothetical protein
MTLEEKKVRVYDISAQMNKLQAELIELNQQIEAEEASLPSSEASPEPQN